MPNVFCLHFERFPLVNPIILQMKVRSQLAVTLTLQFPGSLDFSLILNALI